MISSTLKKTAGLTLALAVAVFSGGAEAQTGAGPAVSAWAETEQTALRLIAATETTGRAKTLRFGLHFKMKPGWKVYWRSPGDAGFPPVPDWSPSRNLKSAVLHWPAPERFSVLGLETLGYEDEVVLPMTVEPSNTSQPLALAGTIRYLTCNKICIPYEAQVALNLPPGPVKLSPFAHLIDRFQAGVPGDGSRHGLAIEEAETWTQGGDTWLRVRATATQPFQAPDLYPEGPPELSFFKPAVRLGGGDRRAVLDVKVFGLKDVSEAPVGMLAGRVLTLTLVDGQRAAEKRLMVVPAVGAGGGGTPMSIAVILMLAVLGGLILNLMPCVLPVLSIKLLSVVGHGGGESRLVRLSFVASAAGIMFAFGVMAAALVALKAAGMTVGWGIQFQQPWFLIAMTLVVTAFACNLWGFFEIRLPAWVSDWGVHTSHGHWLGGHFLQGVFATLLATPCSAPFLGTAVGFALARGWVEIALVFNALGLGLSLPYLAVAVFPALATWLPKPGPWMVTLRKFLGLALAGTGVWLLTVLAVSVGSAAAVTVGTLSAVAVAVLFLGRLAPQGLGRKALLWLGVVVLAAFLVPAWLGEAPRDIQSGVQGSTPGGIVFGSGSERSKTLEGLWKPFDETTVAGLVRAGKTVFVDVTAEWCLTCQINKVFVLNNEAVLAAFGGENVVVMQADWTRPDPAISAFLARHQHYGIPFDAVYGPGAPGGLVLPELLSEKAVLDAFEKAAGAKLPAGRQG